MTNLTKETNTMTNLTKENITMTYQLQTVCLTKAEFTFVINCLFENLSSEFYISEPATPEYVQHLKEVFNEIRPTFIHDTKDHAFECILEFGSDYQMYLSYLSQFRVTTKGEQVRFVPVSYKVYNKLYDEKLTLDLEAWDHLNDMQAEQAQDIFELETNLPF